jgi:ring-1,2-phenylacetyl-CoA epoxidase subunit PaaE
VTALVRSDDAPTPPRAPRHAVVHELRVAAVDRLTADAVAVTFEVPEELREAFRFRAGQHVSVRAPVLGDDTRRTFSICTPATSGTLRIAVKRIPGGAFSTYAMERLRPGDALEVLTPTGRFSPSLDPSRSRRYGAVAAGSGITPVLSILSTALEVEPRSTAALVYVNRTVESVMFLEEVEDLKDRYLDRFQLVHVLTREPRDVDLLAGRLDRERLERILVTVLPVDDVDEWYLCGPPALAETCRGALLERGVPPECVHRELFHADPAGTLRRGVLSPAAPGPASADGEEAVVTVVLDGRRHTLRVRRGVETVLTAALRARPDTPFACRNAVCGTCRARVLEGQVEMDAAHALEPAEVAAGYVLTCQAHPVTPHVVLDYDQ